jgi:hypothetical protein
MDVLIALLIQKSADAKVAGEAMQYAQAALNAANALRALDGLKS